MNEIVFQTLVSTATGVGASTGKHTEEAFNTNFELVKHYLDMLLGVAAITVTSEQITQIKVDTSTTPYSLYYTMDPVDTDPSEVVWYDLDNVAFADIQGEPTDNIALATVLNAKADTSTVNGLSTTVSSLSSTVTDHTTAIGNNTSAIAANTQSINGIRSDMVHLVHSPTSDGTLYLRYNTTHTRVEYSLDNSQWFNIASGAVDFADIAGNPTSNNNLVSYVTNSISQAIQGVTADFVSTQTFNAHALNKNNPHEVTKAQIGLGNVDNTADLDKPIPTAMQEEINALWTRYPESQVLGVTDYQDLFKVKVTDQPVVSDIAVSGESMSIASGGIFTCSHSPVAVGSVTITDDYLSTYTVDEDNNIVDDSDNVVGTFTYATGIVTSTGLEISAGSINYSYVVDHVSAGGIINLGNLFVDAGSIEITDGANTYTDNGSGNLVDGSSNIVATIDYATGVITSTTLVTTSAATVDYSYDSIDGPGDVLYYTSSNFNGVAETLNPSASTYATKGYVDGLIGDINTVLSSLTTD